MNVAISISSWQLLMLMQNQCIFIGVMVKLKNIALPPKALGPLTQQSLVLRMELGCQDWESKHQKVTQFHYRSS